MKKFYILFLIMLFTGCSVNTLGSKISENLKVSKDDVLYSNEYTEYEYKDGEIISQKQIVSYAYKSGELAPVLENEIIEKRTENIVTKNLGGLKRSARSGYNFYQKNGEWKKVKFATTTPEIFNQVSWLDSFIAWALDTGATSPGTMATSNANSGVKDWADPDNVKVSNDSWALSSFTTFQQTSAISYYLKATNFGFSISGDIDGIFVEIEKHSNTSFNPDTNFTQDSEVKIVKSDASIGAENKGDTVTKWNEDTDTTINYGAVDDLWSEGWSDSDINNSNFGVVISGLMTKEGTRSVAAYVDHIQITVYYTEGAPPVLPAATGINIIMID